MSGTPAGGAKAAATNKARYGEDFYKVQGSKGGAKGRGPGYQGGFAHPNADPRKAGAIGGRISKRRKAKKEVSDEQV